MNVRRLTVDDCAALVGLLDQLGYPSTEPSLAVRAERLLADPDVGSWVAVDQARVIGLATGHLSWHIEFDVPAARLTALVVDEEFRGRGVARRLTGAFEEWALFHGASAATLNSGTARPDAHAAYERLGWARTGVRFSKALAPAPPRGAQ